MVLQNWNSLFQFRSFFFSHSKKVELNPLFAQFVFFWICCCCPCSSVYLRSGRPNTLVWQYKEKNDKKTNVIEAHIYSTRKQHKNVISLLLSKEPERVCVCVWERERPFLRCNVCITPTNTHVSADNDDDYGVNGVWVKYTIPTTTPLLLHHFSCAVCASLLLFFYRPTPMLMLPLWLPIIGI